MPSETNVSPKAISSTPFPVFPKGKSPFIVGRMDWDGIQNLWALAIGSPMVDIRIQVRQKCSRKSWEESLAKMAHM